MMRASKSLDFLYIYSARRIDIGHLWGLMLMAQQYLPFTCPTAIPYHEWQNLESKRGRGELTRVTIDGDAVDRNVGE